jgi:hypothetical protein
LPTAYIAVGLDDWLGASRNLLVELGFVFLGVVFGLYAFSAGRHKAFLIAPSLYLLLILALPFLELSPVKPAVRAVDEIRPGMTESQVRAVIDRHFPERGRFKRPEIGALDNGVLAFVLDKHDGRYDAAAVVITFFGGKCVTAKFDPD